MKNPSLNYDISSIASQSTIYVLPKALPMLVCTKNTALRDMSQDKYSTRLRLVLYLSLNMPRAVFSVQIRGSALSNIYLKRE